MLTVEQTVIPELFIVMEHSCCVVTLSVALVSGSLPLYVQMFKQQMVSLWFHAYHKLHKDEIPSGAVTASKLLWWIKVILAVCG